MRLKLRFAVSAGAAVLLLTAAGHANQFVARLTGIQEPAHVITAAHGTGTFSLTEAGLAYKITVDGLSGPIGAAHFHDAALGVDGSIVRTITFNGNTANGIWTPTDAEPLSDNLKSDLLLGRIYVNVHTSMHAGGEIRGQVILSSGTGLATRMIGAQENHAVTTFGRGTASFALVEEGLIYKISVDGLSGPVTEAHLYNAPFGMDGPAVKTIVFNGNTAEDIWHYDDSEPLSDSLRAQIVEGNVYLNVATYAYPNGEIRGQLRLNESWAFQARINAAQENHTDTSTAKGTATFQLTESGLMYKVSVSGLTGPIGAAHIHMGAAGYDGPIIRTLSFSSNGSAEGLWTTTDAEPFTDSAKAELLRGHLYLNVHTSLHPDGEIRGQISLHPTEAQYSADLTGDAEKNNVVTNGRGTGAFRLSGDSLYYQITVDSLAGAISGAHFHFGTDGVPGPVLRTISESGNTMSGVWTMNDAEPFTPAVMREVLDGDVYVEIHTTAYPSGELRGQVIATNGATFANELTGEQETAHDTLPGMGAGYYMLTPAGLDYKITVHDLTGTISEAHFYNGEAGQEGPAVKTIAFDGNTATGTWTSMDNEPLTDNLIAALLEGKIYVNIHTVAHAGGEIRGQVFLNAGTGFGAGMDGTQETPPNASGGAGTTGTILTEEGLMYDATVTMLTGPIIATHFHRAVYGIQGPIIKPLNFSGTEISGIWRMTDPSSAMTVEDVNSLNAGNIYINAHTTQYSEGEIRGQLGTVEQPSAVGPNTGNTATPGLYNLAQNYPNPFNPSTIIHFDVAREAHVRLTIFNTLGQKVMTLVDNNVTAGAHNVIFNGESLPSGIYFYKLEAGGTNLTRKMVLLK